MTRAQKLVLVLAGSVAATVAACGSTGGASTSSTTSSATAGAGVSTGSSSGGGFDPSGATTASSTSTASAASSSSGSSAIDASLGDFCGGQGNIPIPGTTDCTGDIAKKIFLFSMCACTDFTANNTLDTDSLDSKMGPKKLAGGSVGVNGSYSSSAPTNIGGALLVAGTMTTQNTHDVVHDLSCNGDAKIGAPAVAEKDAYVGGNVIGPPKDLTVQGKLHTPIDANAAQVNALGGVVAGAVSVAPPCDCSGPVDIPAIVAAFKGTNDNATNGVAADALTDKPNYPKDLTLPCGRYYLNGINVNQTVSLHLAGRTVLAIEGDVVVSGPFSIDLAPGAELDLFITGNVQFMNTSSMGSVQSPASTRGYIAGNQVLLSGPLSLAGNLYLPNAQFHATNNFEMFGAIFAKSILTDGSVKVHYDEAILSVDGCEPPGTPCTDCHDCVNPAPACGNAGVCGPCTTNQDCCAPLVCDGMGSCVHPPPN